MNYDDFQLLTDSEYFLINSHYSNSLKPNNKELINEICNTLFACTNYCKTINEKLNLKLQNILNETFQRLSFILNNLTSTFNVSTTKNFVDEKFNIFLVCECIISLLNLHKNWILIEEKEYYKKLAINNFNELIIILKNIFSALKNSFVLTFKYM